MSQGPFASLNAAASVGDDPRAVEENLKRLAKAAGVAPGALVMLSQVHGDRVVEALSPTGALDAPRPPLAEADAVWTQAPGVAVGVRTADCVPILIADPVGRRVAAVHAGWRGVIAEIVARTVEALATRGTKPSDLQVALGPCIQRCCFEVDGDLPGRFQRAFGPDVVVPVAGKTRQHLDLPAALRHTLSRCGVDAARVETLGQCTLCDPRFFSHRRDHGRTGRHLSFIACTFATTL